MVRKECKGNAASNIYLIDARTAFWGSCLFLHVRGNKDFILYGVLCFLSYFWFGRLEIVPCGVHRTRKTAHKTPISSRLRQCFLMVGMVSLSNGYFTPLSHFVTGNKTIECFCRTNYLAVNQSTKNIEVDWACDNLFL